MTAPSRLDDELMTNPTDSRSVQLWLHAIVIFIA